MPVPEDALGDLSKLDLCQISSKVEAVQQTGFGGWQMAVNRQLMVNF